MRPLLSRGLVKLETESLAIKDAIAPQCKAEFSATDKRLVDHGRLGHPVGTELHSVTQGSAKTRAIVQQALEVRLILRGGVDKDTPNPAPCTGSSWTAAPP